MVHTLPDYTTQYKLTKIFGQIDNGELAARLGSGSTLDRRGNLIWFDDFEAATAAKWAYSIDPGGTAAYSDERCWFGNKSMKTVTDTDIGDDTILAKSFDLPQDQRIAAEIMFRMWGGKPVVSLQLLGYTGDGWFRAWVKYDHNLQKLYYYNDAAAWVELERLDDTTNFLEPWFFIKLVVDWNTKKYVRFIFCNTEYDLSSLYLRSGAAATMKHLEIYIYNTAGTAAASTVYFDNFILTQNEP